MYFFTRTKLVHPRTNQKSQLNLTETKCPFRLLQIGSGSASFLIKTKTQKINENESEKSPNKLIRNMNRDNRASVATMEESANHMSLGDTLVDETNMMGRAKNIFAKKQQNKIR